MSEEFKDYIKSERTFLHDLSNKLVVGVGMGGFVLSVIEERTDIDPKTVERMQKTLAALESIAEKVVERRNQIKDIKTD